MRVMIAFLAEVRDDDWSRLFALKRLYDVHHSLTGTRVDLRDGNHRRVVEVVLDYIGSALRDNEKAETLLHGLAAAIERMHNNTKRRRYKKLTARR